MAGAFCQLGNACEQSAPEAPWRVDVHVPTGFRFRSAMERKEQRHVVSSSERPHVNIVVIAQDVEAALEHDPDSLDASLGIQQGEFVLARLHDIFVRLRHNGDLKRDGVLDNGNLAAPFREGSRRHRRCDGPCGQRDCETKRCGRIEPWHHRAVLLALAVIIVVIGLVGLVVPALPGTPLVFAGLLLAAWSDGFVRVGIGTIVALGVLTVATYGVDVAAMALGMKHLGATKRAMAGAALGTIVGVFFGLPGLIIGPFAGAVLGELTSRADPRRAARAGVAAWIGFLIGTVVKIGLTFTMVAIFLFAWFVS